ncbi:conserved hypothetical protein [Acidovorax delafieldii 2AN]|uniref:PD-(D/E)XK endonuclease-like domain-containing protein n=1 Tax=Acidovorax delafieldii 2AN TaxID=573060 RepID=C5T063_ACIDE|nr:PD-(D/E)XK nuclease family protein [Acidovorax delafieldii]EER62171.1 conserved hypothetical protein [Acidovorax delafieldii 2AN]
MNWSAAYVLAGLVLAPWLVRLWIRRRPSGERASRPRELANAELVYMETLFRIREPIRLVAKVDRVYRLPGGSLVLVELKTRWRDRAYPSDVIQLSAQKLAIERQTGQTVEPYALVSVLRPDGRLRSHRVRLLGLDEVLNLKRRHKAILDGHLRPSYALSEASCRQCALRHRCDRPAPH